MPTTRYGPALYQHDPHPVDGCGPAGQLRPSRAPRWRWRPVMYTPVAALPAVRPGGSDLAEPRPLRAVDRPRVDAAVLDAAPEPASRPSTASTSSIGEPTVTLDDIKKFRQLDSKCPGHPEYRWTSRRRDDHRPARPGRRHQRRHGDRAASGWRATSTGPGFEMFDHDVYALCGDGCMMEGISGEAASLAGHLKLSNLCWIYDNNQHHDRGPHRAGVQRGRRHPLHRLRLERRCASATPTTWRCWSAPSRRSRRRTTGRR